MRIKSIISLFSLLLLTSNVMASRVLLPRAIGVGDNATQFVFVFNSLANLTIPDPGRTKTNVNVVYYDANTPTINCWSAGVTYNSEPYGVGAGGRNGCGKNDTKITKIDIVPIVSAGVNGVSPAYAELDGVAIDPTKRMSFVFVEQKTAPAFDPVTGVPTMLGTISARIVTSVK